MYMGGANPHAHMHAHAHAHTLAAGVDGVCSLCTEYRSLLAVCEKTVWELVQPVPSNNTAGSLTLIIFGVSCLAAVAGAEICQAKSSLICVTYRPLFHSIAPCRYRIKYAYLVPYFSFIEHPPARSP